MFISIYLVSKELKFQLKILFQFRAHESITTYTIADSHILNQNELINWNDMLEYIQSQLGALLLVK